MNRSIPAARIATATLAAIVLAACAESSTDSTAPRGLSPTEPLMNTQEFNSPRHIFHTKEFYARPGGKPGSGTGITFHGGSVIAAPSVTKVVAIYWGAGSIYAGQASGAGPGTADPTLIGSFLRSLGGSPYFNINATYYGASGAKVVNQVDYTGYWSTGAEVAGPTASPTDAQMINVIQQGFNLGRLTYDPNTVYAIFTGSGINLGGGFGAQYCAYHTNGSTSRGVVLYAAMPRNQDYPSGCTSQLPSPNADVAANSEVNTLAHEIEETTTDPMGNAWYDSRGYENADKCAWTWGTTASAPTGGTYNMKLSDGKYYLVQQNWVNAGSGGCAISY